MKIAVQGCCHGELDAIYAQIARLEQTNGYKVDCLLICGDFQAIRNHQDLQCMAVPNKYKQLGGFYKYYTGEKEAPILTLVIGGNHEASNYMWELYQGGWLAPKIYFLGFAGCVQVNGIKIAGMSGIYSAHHYGLGHFEKIPYDNNTMRSIYHIREYDAFRLSHLTDVDVFLSHDWPAGITIHGDAASLLRRKPYFRADIESGALGSPPAMDLLRRLKPKWWFSAHLHCRFEATVQHGGGDSSEGLGQARGDNPDEIVIDDDLDADEAAAPGPPESSKADNAGEGNGGPPSTSEANPNPDEILLDDELEDVAPPPRAPEITRFLALDKCLPRRQYLEVVDVPSPMDDVLPDTPRLSFDPEWLAITRAFHAQLSTVRAQPRLPNPKVAVDMVKRELEWVQSHIGATRKDGTTAGESKPIIESSSGTGPGSESGLKDVDECQVFWPTAPGPGSEGGHKFSQPPWYTNPQTEAFCGMLELENKVNPVPKELRQTSVEVHALVPPVVLQHHGKGSIARDPTVNAEDTSTG